MRKVKRFCVFSCGSANYFFSFKQVLDFLEQLGLGVDDVSFYVTGGECILVDCE